MHQRFSIRSRFLLLVSAALATAVPYPAQVITTFDPAGSTSTFPRSINGAGEIAGFYRDASNVNRGFVRDDEGNITTFDPAGSTNTVPASINGAGEITGSYRDASDVSHGFVRSK